MLTEIETKTDNYDLIEKTDMAKDAMGGTELMMRRIYNGSVSRDLLEQFQIIPTRVRDLNPNKYRILYIHDLTGDPEVSHLANEGWRKFHRLVFVSNWQCQRFIDAYQIPWSKCVVMLNAVEPLKEHRKRNDDVVHLVYHSTPHRGLDILLSVFDFLRKQHNIHLHLYSSYKLYGWEGRDEHYKNLFDFANSHENITNHGTVSHDVLINDLPNYDVFAYPSTWPETSCLCLMEAMSAGLFCVHPNYGALYETAANWTSMYTFHEDPNEHAKIFAAVLEHGLNNLDSAGTEARCQSQRIYTNSFYAWQIRAMQWTALLQGIIANGEKVEIPAEEFVYRPI